MTGAPLFYEDLSIGQQFRQGSYTIDKDAGIAFAGEFDPQYFHLDEHKAKDSFFGQLVVSGWHTAAVTMRLKAQSALAQIAGGLVGLGTESMRWPKPVYPGDDLSIVITIVDKRPSKSKPRQGIVKYKVETLNQKRELVMEMLTSILVPCKSPVI